MSEQKDNKEKLIMIVNGQPIEMCQKTFTLCNKRAQYTLRAIKRQSLNTVHTMRLFWGDVILLNILTNQMLQKVDSKSLARVLRPINTLAEDLEEYREMHKKQVENLKDALIIACDKDLPLDYSRELEKYYKEEYVLPSEKEQMDFGVSISPPPTQPPQPIKDESNPSKAPPKNKKTQQKPKSISKKTFDDDEEEVSFFSYTAEEKNDINSEKINDVVEDKIDKTRNHDTESQEVTDSVGTLQNEQAFSQEPPTVAKTELERNQEAFAQFGTIDIDSMFE